MYAEEIGAEVDQADILIDFDGYPRALHYRLQCDADGDEFNDENNLTDDAEGVRIVQVSCPLGEKQRQILKKERRVFEYPGLPRAIAAANEDDKTLEVIRLERAEVPCYFEAPCAGEISVLFHVDTPDDAFDYPGQNDEIQVDLGSKRHCLLRRSSDRNVTSRRSISSFAFARARLRSRIECGGNKKRGSSLAY